MLIIRTFFVFCFLSGSASALTLSEALEFSLSNMESLKIADHQIEQQEFVKKKARGALLPTINGVGSYTKIDPPRAAGNNPFLLTRQYSWAMRLTQPLLRGGSIAALGVADEQRNLALLQRETTIQNLSRTVIQAYAQYSLSFRDQQILNESLKINQTRFNEMKRRYQVGKIRKGEFLEADAQLDRSKVAFENASKQLQVSKKNLEFYIGREISSEPPMISLGTPSLVKAEQLKRSEILVAEKEQEIAKKMIEIQKGDHYPRLDLITNYYFDRTGILSTSNWDIGLQVSVPLFQGGVVYSSVKEAQEKWMASKLNENLKKRQVENENKILESQISQNLSQLDYAKQVLKKSQSAFEATKTDDKFGLISQLEVLQSLNNYVQAQRELSLLEHETFVLLKTHQLYAGEKI